AKAPVQRLRDRGGMRHRFSCLVLHCRTRYAPREDRHIGKVKKSRASRPRRHVRLCRDHAYCSVAHDDGGRKMTSGRTLLMARARISQRLAAPSLAVAAALTAAMAS